MMIPIQIIFDVKTDIIQASPKKRGKDIANVSIHCVQTAFITVTVGYIATSQDIAGADRMEHHPSKYRCCGSETSPRT